MLTWAQTEFLLKGVYLGLLVMIAWLVPGWGEVAIIALCTRANFRGLKGELSGALAERARDRAFCSVC